MEAKRPEAKYPEITLGEPICIKIKEMYFSDEKWPNCYRKVADKFTLFKRIMRKIYPDKDTVEILKSVQKFSTQDIQDIFDMEKDYLVDGEKVSLSGPAKYDKKVQWIPVPVDKPEVMEKIRKILTQGDVP